MARGVPGTAPVVRCLDCGVLIGPAAKRCNKCYGKTKRVRPVIRTCVDCGVRLGNTAHKVGGKRCRKCAPRVPASRAGRSAAMKALFEREPGRRDRCRENLAKLDMNSPEIRAKTVKKRGEWRTKVRRARMGWCPEEYWEAYKRLRKRQIPNEKTGRQKIKVDGKWRWNGRHFGSAKAREMIERHFGGPLKPVSMTWPQLIKNECTIGDKVVRVAPAAAQLLVIMLLQHPYGYLTNTELIERMWPDPDLEPDTAVRIIDQYILRLRRVGVCIVRAKGFGRGYRIPPEARKPLVR